MTRNRYRCDCGKKPVKHLKVRFLSGGSRAKTTSVETIPLCADCLKLEREQAAELERYRR